MRRTTPLVDILLGTYNGSRFLLDQIASLQAQTHKCWDLYVRDDASSDSTPAMVAEIARSDRRVRLVLDQLGNLGFNANYHLLLSQAKADYVMFSDQDDHWDTTKIAKTLDVMRRHEALRPDSPILVHCDACVADAKLLPVSKSFVGARARLKGLVSVLLANPAQGASIMINRPLRDLLLRRPPLLPYDYKAALIAEATGSRLFLAEPLLLYRQHESNAIGTSGPSASSGSSKQFFSSPTLRLGLDAATSIEATLLQVRDRWHPTTERLLCSHMRFVEPGPSLAKLGWIATHRYGFYRRSDLAYAVLHALGLTSAR